MKKNHNPLNVFWKFILLGVTMVSISCDRKVHAGHLNQDNIVFVVASRHPAHIVVFDDYCGKYHSIDNDLRQDIIRWNNVVLNKNMSVYKTAKNSEQDIVSVVDEVVFKSGNISYLGQNIQSNVKSVDFALKTNKYLYWGGEIKFDEYNYNMYCIGRFDCISGSSLIVRIAGKERHFDWSVFPAH